MNFRSLLLWIVPVLLNSLNAQEIIRLEGEAQGTTYHITYLDSLGRDLQPEIEDILADFDQSVSTYQPYSIISRINRGEENVEVDPYFIACFSEAKRIWKATKGAFDPTVYPLVNAWGFGPGRKETIGQELIDSLLQFVGFGKMELVNGKIVRKDVRVGLDFNAFAQGYSVDVVSDFLRGKGLRNFIVEIGGEVYASGRQPDGNNWLIGIEQPVDNQLTANPLLSGLRLENKGVATSGDYRRFIVENGVKYAHHIDPKTGYPTKNNLLSATVVSDKCIVSDATATGLLVMGLQKAKKYLKKHRELEVLLIYSDENGNYRFFQTPGMKSLLVDLGN